jgi:hypothetical protein
MHQLDERDVRVQIAPHWAVRGDRWDGESHACAIDAQIVYNEDVHHDYEDTYDKGVYDPHAYNKGIHDPHAHDEGIYDPQTHNESDYDKETHNYNTDSHDNVGA